MATYYCWELLNCDKKECPAYNNENEYCWLISGTFCRGEIQGTFIEKIEACLNCKVFQNNINTSNIKETLELVNKQFQEFRSKYDERVRESEEASMEMALAFSEMFNVLQEYNKGNYSVQVNEESKIEIISQLAKIINKVIAETGALLQEMDSAVKEFSNILNEVENGDYSIRIKKEFSNNDIIQLKDLLNDFLSDYESKITESYNSSMELALGLSESFEALRQISEGNFEVRASEEYENELLAQLGKVINQTGLKIKTQIEEIQKMKQEEEEKRREYLESRVNKILNAIKEVSKGILTVKIEPEKEDESIIIEIINGLNQMIDNLKNIINQIKSASEEISSSSSEIASANTEIKSISETNLKQADSASSTTTEMAASIKQVAHNAEIVTETANRNKELITKLYNEMNEIIKTFKKISETTNKTSQKLNELNKSAERIDEIVSTITKISEKSDLLALNAAIEASVAGEAGRRFRIVADEMRRLADNSLQSSKQISEILKDIYSGIKENSKDIELITKSVDEMNNVISMAAESISKAVSAFEKTVVMMKEVSLATSQQAKGTELLMETIQELTHSAQQTVTAVEQTSIAITHFIELSHKMNEIVAEFKV